MSTHKALRQLVIHYFQFIHHKLLWCQQLFRIEHPRDERFHGLDETRRWTPLQSSRQLQLPITYGHTHTHRLTALCPWLPGWAGTRKVKPIWILLKQETVSSSGISWAVCKSAPHSRQITMPAPHHSVFYRPDALPATQPTASKHWRQNLQK